MGNYSYNWVLGLFNLKWREVLVKIKENKYSYSFLFVIISILTFFFLILFLFPVGLELLNPDQPLEILIVSFLSVIIFFDLIFLEFLPFGLSKFFTENENENLIEMDPFLE